MRTMHPVLKRGGLYWDRELLPPGAYEERFSRIQGAIAASGDDAWLLFGDVERYGALAWFSNFLPRTRSALALAPRAGAPTLLVSVGLRDVPAAKTLTWIDDVRPFSRLPRALTALMEERGLAGARIGLAGIEELLSIKDWGEIEAGLPVAQFASRAAQVAALRASKDDCEFAALRLAAKVVSGGLDRFAEALKTGANMREVFARAERFMRANAAEDVRVMCAGGAQCGVALRPLEDRVVRDGDVVMIYVAAEVQRYWAEEARTFVVGVASPAMRNLAARARAAHDAMAAAARPGVACARVAEAAERALEAAHLVDSARGYGFGCGIGFDAEETPAIARGSHDVVSPRSALALRVIVHEDGIGVALAGTLHLRDGEATRFGGPGFAEIASGGA